LHPSIHGPKETHATVPAVTFIKQRRDTTRPGFEFSLLLKSSFAIGFSFLCADCVNRLNGMLMG
jgi:hypothetical protein